MLRSVSSCLIAAGGVLLMGLTGCAPNAELQSIQTQLADIQRQVLQLQRQMPTKEAVQALEEQLVGQSELIARAQADEGIRLDALRGQIEQLEANLEDGNYRLAQLSQQVAATNQELKAARTSASFGSSGTVSTSPSVPQDPQALYRSAYNDYLRGNYDLAIQQFQEYIAAFSDTDLSDNAIYWLGECYYRQGKFRLAIGEFDTMLDRFPRSDKTASALLKKGYAYLELNERSQGLLQLQHVIREYPGSDEGNLARQRLRDLGVDSR